MCSQIVFKHSSYVRVVSKQVALNIAHKLKINQEIFKVAPVGISLVKKDFDIKKIIYNRSINKDFNILYIGRFSKEKDLRLWINSAIKMAEIEKKLKFTLIGYGKEKKTVNELINKSRIKHKFNILDKINYKLTAIFN